MEASQELFNKVLEYEKLKSEAEKLCMEIKDMLEKEYLEKTGFTLGVATFEPFISDSANGKREQEIGTYVQEKAVGYFRSDKYWYLGKEFIPVENSEKFIGYEYKR